MNIFKAKSSKKKRFLIFLALFFTLFLNAIAQDNREISNQLVQVADEIYTNTTAYVQARDAYIQVLDFEPDNLKANYMAGYLYLQTINKERAVPYLLKVYNIDSEYSFDLLYLIGRAYQFALDFDNAKKYYNQYIDLYNREPDYKGDDKISLEEAEKHIRECDVGKELVSSPLNYNITNVGSNINSEWPDYGPSVNKDESIMVFTTRRLEGNVNSALFQDNFPYEDIFISTRVNGQWTKARNISHIINTPYFESSLAISNDGRELYLYLDENNGDIYISNKINSETWSVPEPISSINTVSKETSAALSPDDKVMFFASDRAGSFGGLDIYYCTKDRRGEWTNVKNLGPEINTEENDDFPFIAQDGKTLYFSSEGHDGMGGYDIYKTVYDSSQNTWIKPVNIGYPINTPDNDIAFITTGNGDKGYFSSVREDGYGYSDIYMFTVPEEIQNVTEEEPEIRHVVSAETPIRLLLHIRDEQGGPIDATVKVRNNSGNFLAGVSRLTMGEYTSTVNNREPVEYQISAEKDGYLFHSEKARIPGMSSDEQVFEYNIVLKGLRQGASSVLRNVYFDFDKATLKPKSIVEINKLYQMLSENSQLIAEIGGHTDNIGSKNYNYRLSYQRAKTVVDYLVKKGIQPERLKAVGYGEDRPLASNDDEHGGRELNRRVEFRVLKYIE